MGMADPSRRAYRVIAEGNDHVGDDLALAEAIAVMEFTRQHGGRHVAIIDEETGALVDEGDARRAVLAP